ncbi:MAG: PQQ-dependent sugar dehydrogenase [Planctomycetota bacterium]|nr:PQQ-dependent sugar dehydrogenase [Planctomycetota bacterium]
MTRFLTLVGAAALSAGLATCSRPDPRGASSRSDELPPAPEGTRLSTVTRFEAGDQDPVRIAACGLGNLYVLGAGGDVTYVQPYLPGGRQRVLRGEDYLEQPERQELHIPLPVDERWVNSPIRLRATLCLGLTFDRENRMYIVANVQLPGEVWINRVDIYRTAPVTWKGPSKPELWTRFAYPYGVGGFNHGACRIAQGPDGMIYLGSGARTDHGEAGEEPHISRSGEGPDPGVSPGAGISGEGLTASILRFDPRKGQQIPEVFSRGNRNPYGFDWDDQGRLIDCENGPMADHPEELNHIREGKHYGFPYVFGKGETPDYEDRAVAPAGLSFEDPIENLGPGGLLGDHSLHSFAPHSCPAGLVFYPGGEIPERYHGTFFVARYGNLVGYSRLGFDVLNVRLEETEGRLVAHTERFLERLGRPSDLCVTAGRLYVLEYCRQTETAGPGSQGYVGGGRVIEVAGARPLFRDRRD